VTDEDQAQTEAMPTHRATRSRCSGQGRSSPKAPTRWHRPEGLSGHRVVGLGGAPLGRRRAAHATEATHSQCKSGHQMAPLLLMLPCAMNKCPDLGFYISGSPWMTAPVGTICPTRTEAVAAVPAVPAPAGAKLSSKSVPGWWTGRPHRVEQAQVHLVERALTGEGEHAGQVLVGIGRGDRCRVGTRRRRREADLSGVSPNSMAMLSYHSPIVASIIGTPSTSAEVELHRAAPPERHGCCCVVAVRRHRVEVPPSRGNWIRDEADAETSGWPADPLRWFRGREARRRHPRQPVERGVQLGADGRECTRCTTPYTAVAS